MADTIESTILPSYCHIRSPTLGKWCPLQARDIPMLQEIRGFEGQNIFFYNNHPIRYVRLVGIIVEINEFEAKTPKGSGRWIAILDDGCGTNIEVVCAAPRKEESMALPVNEGANKSSAPALSSDGPDLTGLDVGSVVKVKGSITHFRGQRQIQLKRIALIADTNEEVRCWTEMVVFKRDVLSVPWTLSEEEQEECLEQERKEAAMLEKEADRRRRKLRKKALKEEVERKAKAEAEELQRAQKEALRLKAIRAKKREDYTRGDFTRASDVKTTSGKK